MIDLSGIRKIKGVKFWSEEANQLYHPTGVFPQDSQDLVYSQGVLNKNKFSPILLKEWFYLLQKNGFLVIDYKPNSLLDWQGLEEQMWWLWKGKYKVVYHGPVSSLDLRSLTETKLKRFIQKAKSNSLSDMVTETRSNNLRFICQKDVSTQIKNDSIDKWTFGLVTNGKRMDWVEEIIRSIRSQKIPHYEIIICGTIPPRVDKDIKHIPFSARDDRGWITRKKNIIAKNAKYENLCVIHDRLVFNQNWYKGMRKWGNCFDILSCVQTFENKRINDWEMHEELPGLEFSFVSLMDYRDWDFQSCEGGQLHILKKTLANNVLWNETFYWGRPEDLRISNDLRDAGHILRFNPESSLKALAYRFGVIPEVPYDSMRLPITRTGDPFRLIGRKLYKCIYKYSYLKRMMIMIFKKISK